MSLLHADGFAHYGTGATSETNMALGLWASISTGVQALTTNPRSPGTHHLRIGGSNDEARRVFGADKASGVGVGFALYLLALPSANQRAVVLQLRDGTNTAKLTLELTTTGVLNLRQGDHTGTILASSAAVFTAGAYQHFECKAILNAVTGQVEVRRNGVTVLSFNGNTGSGTLEQYAMRWQGTAGANDQMDFADLHAWDVAGAVNNTFLGDVVWYPVRPTADQAASDFVRNTGSADFSCINEATPDGDTTYIEAGTAGNVSEFSMTDLPATAGEIIGVFMQPMSRKTDAGAGNLRVSLLSGASVAAGTDRPITTIYTYYPDVFETDPATGVKWTPSGINAMNLRLARTL